MPEPKLLTYPVPWDVVFSLTPNLRSGIPVSFDDISRRIAERLTPEPLIEGLEHLPPSPRFVLAANHYERKGLWIAHSACTLTQIIRRRYARPDGSSIDPPVRWVVTANFPRLNIGPIKLPSPGDLLLPRVAHVLSCYPVSFVGSDPAATAASVRRLLRDAPNIPGAIGLFPEGVAGRAGQLAPPLPGVGRLLVLLARLGFSVQPVGISEAPAPDGRLRFVFRFGAHIPTSTIAASGNPGELVMHQICELATQ
jgi:hypothetical protein